MVSRPRSRAAPMADNVDGQVTRPVKHASPVKSHRPVRPRSKVIRPEVMALDTVPEPPESVKDVAMWNSIWEAMPVNVLSELDVPLVARFISAKRNTTASWSWRICIHCLAKPSCPREAMSSAPVSWRIPP